MPLIKLAVTGGPGGGKSTFMEVVKKYGLANNIPIIFVPEAARIVFGGAYRPHWPTCTQEERTRFQRAIFRMHIALEDSMACTADPGQDTLMVMDRGILDGRAFLPEQTWRSLCDEINTTDADILGRYDAVLHLVTAADGATEHYKTDGIRNDTPLEAIAFDRRLSEIYSVHPRHRIVASNTDFDAKMTAAMEVVSELMGPTVDMH